MAGFETRMLQQKTAAPAVNITMPYILDLSRAPSGPNIPPALPFRIENLEKSKLSLCCFKKCGINPLALKRSLRQFKLNPRSIFHINRNKLLIFLLFKGDIISEYSDDFGIILIESCRIQKMADHLADT